MILADFQAYICNEFRTYTDCTYSIQEKTYQIKAYKPSLYLPASNLTYYPSLFQTFPSLNQFEVYKTSKAHLILIKS